MNNSLKDIRIFVASSKELERERNYLAYLVLAKEEAFAARGVRVRLAKWEYVDPRMTGARTEDRYLDEMFDCDAAFVLFRNVAGMYTREELDKALEREKAGTSRLKAHTILFAADGAPDSGAARLRAELPEGSYGVWSGTEELRAAFLELVDRMAAMELREAPPDKNVRKITAFLAADDELAEERNAFADTVLNVNDLLERAHHNVRVGLKFYDSENAADVIESSEMGLVLYGTNYRVFGREEIKRIHERVKDAQQNPKRFYVFFRKLDEATERSLDEAFKAFRDDFSTKLGHFTCEFGDANALRLGFLLSLVRYAGESVETYSTVMAPTTFAFVGREAEIRQLHEWLEPVPGAFPAGRLPVVTGAGGTGKSELLRQYASQLRVEYPGGVFQVDMEHVRTWDEAFLGILDGIPNNGIQAADYLDLKAGGADAGKSESLTGAKVRNALLKKSREAGPVLLVLDNVESFGNLLGEGDASAKAFPSGFSERVRVDVVATARACDVPLRPTDWAVPFPLEDLSPEAALDLLLKDKPAVDEKELAAAKRTAELLGRRALYLRRVPAILNGVNKKSKIACRSYAALAELLEKDPLLTINRTATVAEEYLPVRLWELVRNNLSEWGLGEACIKLAEIASFFSSEGCPRHILHHLWGELVFSGLEDWGSQEEVFDQVCDLAKRYNIFQAADPVRIHRLDRAAILQTAKAEQGLEEAVGKALAEYPGMSPDDWLSLAESATIVSRVPEVELLTRDALSTVLMMRNFPTLQKGKRSLPSVWYHVSEPSLQVKLLCLNPALEPICRFDAFSNEDWVSLLVRQPQFAERCPGEILRGKDWVSLLVCQPQFAERCPMETLRGSDWAQLLGSRPELETYCQWDVLLEFDWIYLLARQPQFEKRCPWESVEKIDWQWSWRELLEKQPQFAGHCPWNTLDGLNWAYLLQKQPELAIHCDWKKLNGRNWAELLAVQPRFSDDCPWESLEEGDWVALLSKQPQFEDRWPWKNMEDGWRWAELLGAQPRFAEHCPWEKLTGDSWVKLLCRQPLFGGRCPWEKLYGGNWADLLQSQPQFADRCDWKKLDGWAWAKLLGFQPQFEGKCEWDKLESGHQWAELLAKQPQFAGKCPWETLDGDDWLKLLGAQPRFAVRCAWEKLDGDQWAIWLANRPRFAGHCPWEKLDGGDWVYLLEVQTQFADACAWDKLSGGNWADLLASQPQLADHCAWEKLDWGAWPRLLAAQPHFSDHCPWETLNGQDWAGLLASQPQFADHCDWNLLDGRDWSNLLIRQPQFADHCPWETLNGQDWEGLLASQPQFADHCAWEKLDGQNWAELLGRCPQFAEHCMWDKLNTRYRFLDHQPWVELLKRQPQFAERCPWEKLQVDDWADLLDEAPQLADYCPWDNLDGSDWADLLRYHPQFAERCCWEKLCGWNWAELLGKQPQFSDLCPWNTLTGQDWANLLRFQPRFAEHCDWDLLDGRDWAELLGSKCQFAERCHWEKLNNWNWKELLEKQPQFAVKCPWKRMVRELASWPRLPRLCDWNQLDGADWSDLLWEHPEFSNRCAWQKLGGEDWCYLLLFQPQFADRCAWEKLDGSDWSRLLRDQPQFAEQCRWEKLGGLDWRGLLQERPQFADHCDWTKLSEDDWKTLLEKQPQFAKKREVSIGAAGERQEAGRTCASENLA